LPREHPRYGGTIVYFSPFKKSNSISWTAGRSQKG
jgi:hypothetical protein